MDYSDRATSTQHIMRQFRLKHLPPHLQTVSQACADLAHHMTNELPDSPELTVALRKLLEAKDCFVRSAVAMHEDTRMREWNDLDEA